MSLERTNESLRDENLELRCQLFQQSVWGAANEDTDASRIIDFTRKTVSVAAVALPRVIAH